MALIRLFSAPKPFTDSHIAIIQRNAIKSWTLLPDVDVLLIGNETGVAETAKELDVKHLTDVKCSNSGTPLISSMFQLACENSNSDLLCIINTDMILMSDFVEAAQQAVKLRDEFFSASAGTWMSPNRSIFPPIGKIVYGPPSMVRDNSTVLPEVIFFSFLAPVIPMFQTSLSAVPVGTIG